MEPIFLKPVYKDYIWGGTRLKSFLQKEDITTPTVAESWEISTNENGKSRIKNGEYVDKTLEEVYAMLPKREEIFGSKMRLKDRFPLLIKFIDADRNLSVQVHPDDEYAKKFETDTGKTEMWYIMECAKEAQIICGMKESVRQEELEACIREGKIKENLNTVPIEKGDVIYIPAGTIHAILGNTLLCEVQQNSNVTYRVYDWDRVGKDGKPRQLHIDKAIDVIQVANRPHIQKTEKMEEGVISVVDSEFFHTDVIKIKQEYQDQSSKESCYCMNVVEGEGKLKQNEKEYRVKLGDSFLIPASFGNYRLQGTMTLLKSYI